MFVYAVLAGAPDYTAPPWTLRGIYEDEGMAEKVAKDLGGHGYAEVVKYDTISGTKVK